MTTSQQKAMQAGRDRAALAGARESKVRVKDYKRWLAKGSPRGQMPAVPSDADYRTARTLS